MTSILCYVCLGFICSSYDDILIVTSADDNLVVTSVSVDIFVVTSVGDICGYEGYEGGVFKEVNCSDPMQTVGIASICDTSRTHKYKVDDFEYLVYRCTCQSGYTKSWDGTACLKLSKSLPCFM